MNIVKTILEMFEQRDYSDISLDDTYITAIKEDGNVVKAFINTIQKLNVTEIQGCISKLQEEKINHGLIVYNGVPTSVVKVIISNIEELGIHLEIFQQCDLQYNITKHILVPKHIKLAKDESSQFKTNYGINIPVLLKTDSVCKFYDFSKGDIIKVIRRDGFVSFRIVR
jgi:DNA-directed RNA polymerase I, II, and III subunit RPABC1